jgi:radical SAM/Cys-rich protein
VTTSLPVAAFDFSARLERAELTLGRRSLDSLQVNVTKLCNQACRHCHVDSSPKRTEQIDARTVDRCLEILALPGVGSLDLTGGAPELNPEFDRFVQAARALDKRVLVRHNLTVTLDGNPQTGESKAYLPEFFAEQGVEVVSSLPYYQEYFTDKQRGRGVFSKSLESLRLLNAQGIGVPGSGRVLTLVYNPVGSYLPPEQASLEADYRTELREKFGIEFTSLIAITNMPINRFRQDLERRGQYEHYMHKLVAAFNPEAAGRVMCRTLISVDHEGVIYDCDFNQMLGLSVAGRSGPLTVFDLDLGALGQTPIRFADHCFGCTAGAGSSCGGETA